MNRPGFVSIGLLLATACAHSPAEKPAEGHDHGGMATTGEAPLFGNLGAHHRAITTSSPEAQQYFDQGLNLLFGFNHDEAIRSFTKATSIDADCAMCFWGLAYANGPHINNPMLDPDHAKAAWNAIQKAKAKEAKSSEVERAFIDALATRYAADPKADRGPLDLAYSAAMREVWKRFPDDTDAGTLFAESMMDLRPWDQWTKDGKPEPGTEELLAALEAVLAKDPNHPGANHFYIHSLEASPHPEKAMAAAGRVGMLVPGAGHLVHMPAHIYIRVGRYNDSAEANRKAIEVDKEYRAKAGPQGFYSMYMAHNYQFLWASDLWAARSAEAAEAEAGMFKVLPPEMLKAMPEVTDVVLPYPYYRMARFGLWDAIIASAAPPADMPFSNAMWHFARGMAQGAKGQSDDEAKELASLQSGVAGLSDKPGMFMNSPRSIAVVAVEVLAGDLAARKGRVDEAVKHLEAAAKAEDALNYNEPPDWLLPSRHVLGQVLLSAGRASQAEAVYREDLKRNPENGWALVGLSQALKARKSAEASSVEKRAEAALSGSDVKVTASRL